MASSGPKARYSQSGQSVTVIGGAGEEVPDCGKLKNEYSLKIDARSAVEDLQQQQRSSTAGGGGGDVGHGVQSKHKTS